MFVDTDFCVVWSSANSKAVDIVQALMAILGTQKRRRATARGAPRLGLLKTQSRLCVTWGPGEKV